MVGHDPVGEAELEGLVGADRLADEVHLERLGLADEPRQPLGAAEAGDDPEVDLGLPEERRLAPRCRTSHAIASSHPPPKASALTAATTTVDGLRSMLAQQRVRLVDERRAARSSSIWVNALMSAPAQNSERVRRGEHERPHLRASHVVPDRAQVARRPAGEIEFSRRSVSQAMRDVAARLELHDGARLLARVGPRVGEEALAGLLPEAPLGDEPAQDRGRLEVLAPLAVAPAPGAAEAIVVEPPRSARTAAAGPARVMPAPVIIPRSMSVVVATPSSSTRQASTNVLSVTSSTSSTTSGSASPSVSASPCGVETRRRSSRRACRRARARRIPSWHVEAVAVGLVEVLGDVEDGVEAEQVR